MVGDLALVGAKEGALQLNDVRASYSSLVTWSPAMQVGDLRPVQPTLGPPLELVEDLPGEDHAMLFAHIHYMVGV